MEKIELDTKGTFGSSVLVLKRQFDNLEVFDYLWSLIPEEFVEFLMFGKKVKAPRKIATYGQSYNFSGTSVQSRSWDIVILQILIDTCQSLAKLDLSTKAPGFNMVLVNWYKSGEDYIGPHRDDERNFVKDSQICGVSFGSTRKFVFKPYLKTDTTLLEKSYLCENGDLFLFQNDMNKTHTHSIPKDLKVKTPRVSLTFRLFKNGETFTSWQNCASYWQNYKNSLLEEIVLE